MENARQACLKRQMLKFERQSKRKWHERKNSLQNKLTQTRKSREMVIAEKREKNADWLGQPYYHSYPFDSYSFQFHINMIKFIQFVIEVGSILPPLVKEKSK